MQKLTLVTSLGACVAVFALTAGTWSSSSTTPPGAKALEATLLAPCCWGGTLATHDSPVSTELRQEIETRADHGEATTAIEADLVGRYGDRIRAMPKVGAFSNALVIALDAAILALAAMIVAFARWRRTNAEGVKPIDTAPRRDEYDDRIDAELADL